MRYDGGRCILIAVTADRAGVGRVARSRAGRSRHNAFTIGAVLGLGLFAARAGTGVRTIAVARPIAPRMLMRGRTRAHRDAAAVDDEAGRVLAVDRCVVVRRTESALFGVGGLAVIVSKYDLRHRLRIVRACGMIHLGHRDGDLCAGGNGAVGAGGGTAVQLDAKPRNGVLRLAIDLGAHKAFISGVDVQTLRINEGEAGFVIGDLILIRPGKKSTGRQSNGSCSSLHNILVIVRVIGALHQRIIGRVKIKRLYRHRSLDASAKQVATVQVLCTIHCLRVVDDEHGV